MILARVASKEGVLIRITAGGGMAQRVAQREELWRWAVRALQFPAEQVWLDYDEEADVLYISLRKPQHATDSILEDDVIYHYDGKRLVGVTVLNAKHRANDSP